MMTVVSTLQQQQRHVLAYLPEACERLRLCFPPTLSSRKLRRDSCGHNLNGYPSA